MKGVSISICATLIKIKIEIVRYVICDCVRGNGSEFVTHHPSCRSSRNGDKPRF